MPLKKILIQIDGDPHASSFDSIVALDAGVDQLLPYHNVTTMSVRNIIHGAMFTRGGADLQSTAIFFGGSDVDHSTALFRAARKCFFGPVRVSVMSDPNGSNTTAAAAMLSAEKHRSLRGSTVTVLAATGPVGMRIVELAAFRGATVRVCSRSLSRAKQICDAVRRNLAGIESANGEFGELVPLETDSLDQTFRAIDGCDVLFSAGAAGVMLVSDNWLELENRPDVAIDLNAVPPTGIEGVDVQDKGEVRNGTICYGAIGIGGLKMKIHTLCVKQLFESSDQVFDTHEIFRIAGSLLTGK